MFNQNNNPYDVSCGIHNINNESATDTECLDIITDYIKHLKA